MPILKNNKGKMLFFIHIPKAAGTSIKKMLLPDVQLLFDSEFKKELPCPPQHFHAEVLNRLGIDELVKDSFAIVRHPVARFLSEFSYRKKVDRKFKYFNTSTFFYFIRKAYAYNPYILSNHIRPQSGFIWDQSKIFKLEEGIEAICKNYPEFFIQDGHDSIQANSSNSKKVRLDPVILHGLCQFYKHDFELFNYNKKYEVELVQNSRIKRFVFKCIGTLFFHLYRISN
ncbi:sulfotransferase family 2 domain-containing protein [Glaciecola sp. 1036]|uniref:sulfotransferase family 2 domain-containing protein n=1 Tax=Alteromonadaceae TaxID=72275 RepID=UPI003D06E35C